MLPAREEQLTWSREEALEQRRCAIRLLLDNSGNQFTRSLEWYAHARTNVPLAVWTLLEEENFIEWYTLGGDRFRLTISGWIEACRLLRDEVDLDRRFGVLSSHLKRLTLGRTESLVFTSTHAIAEATGLQEIWVSDAVEGHMSKIIYSQHGARLADTMGGVEVPAHIGIAL